LTNPALKAALLGRWERAESPEAPLTEGQREAVNQLAKFCQVRQLPPDVRLPLARNALLWANAVITNFCIFWRKNRRFS
jgi:hypothetical protein